MADRKRERRRNLLIHPEFQLRLITYAVLAAFALIVFFYLTNVYLFWQFQSVGERLGLSDSNIYFGFLDEQKRTVRAMLLVSSVLLLHLVLLGALILSHRIAGPILRMQRHFEAIVEKRREPGPIRLREGDYFAGLVLSYNRQFEEESTAPPPEVERRSE